MLLELSTEDLPGPLSHGFHMIVIPFQDKVKKQHKKSIGRIDKTNKDVYESKPHFKKFI
jgi:hypothetical protein